MSSKQGKTCLSVAIITLNESRNIKDCLDTVSFADDIVIVDSGSSDETVKIASNYTDRIFINRFKNFGKQKQLAVDKCFHEWVLSIDADERIPEETRKLIQKIIESNPKAVAYSFPRRSFFHGRWIRGLFWWPDRVIRLFRKTCGRFVGEVHEGWFPSGYVVPLSMPIDHYPFRNYKDMIQKMDAYSEIKGGFIYKKQRVSELTPIIRGGWMFLRTFFLGRGILYGFDGLVISLMTGLSSFFSYAKALEKTKSEGKTRCSHAQNSSP